MNQESIILLGGGRALLMQVAHPKVAAGVAEHSTFRSDRLGRLRRTLQPMYTIVFGTEEQARQAMRRIERRHEGVAGNGYRADDPDLLLWVHATLVDTALTMYSRFVRPLTPAEERAYYADSLVLGELLGVPRQALPQDLLAFRGYMDTMVAELEVTETAREIAGGIFAPRPRPAAPVFLALRQLAGGLLPARLRDEYGFSWGGRRERLLGAGGQVSRTLWPRLPRAMRLPWPYLP